MKTVVQIMIVEEVADEDIQTVLDELKAVTPSNGTVTANPIAAMPQQVWDDTEDAWADALGWTETVPNPDFDSEQPVSEQNPETIPNPTSKPWNVTAGWRKRSELLLRNRAKKLARTQAESTVDSSVDHADAAITVIDGNE